MSDPELELLIKEKMHKFIPSRPAQVLHCGVIVLVSIVIGVLNLSPDPNAVQNNRGPGAWLGVLLAASGLAIYFVWTSFRIAQVRKEANEEFLAASLKKSK